MVDESPQRNLFDETGASFEVLAKENGKLIWFARDFMELLGYDSWASFKLVLNKAIGVSMTVGIPVMDHFVQVKRSFRGREVDDFKMTRLACCLIAMNSDPKNEFVAKAQAYFAALDQVVQDVFTIRAESMDRLIARGEISEREITLSKTAADAGVEHQDRFRNAGYQGMYNMDLAALKKLKGVPDLSRPLFDFMGKDELAGNLFRLSLTEGRIKKEQVRGQAALEHVAHEVGARVRKTIIEETGATPESLPIETDIKIVKKGLKSTSKAFARVDNLEQHRIDESTAMAMLPPAPVDGFYPDCPECQAVSQYPHDGSRQCTSGSIASGGIVSHCSCDYCARG